MQLTLVSKAKLPTKWGDFTIVGFEEIETKKDHVALIYGNILTDEPVLTRIHSECLTGDALFSLRCDCGAQLTAAFQKITEQTCGILLYHRQEGRNIGLLNKIKAYALQDAGNDTVEANLHLGFAADERDFSLCSDMLTLLKVKNIRLLTNNPEKIAIMEKNGIQVIERIPLEVGENPYNTHYLETKEKKLGHLLSYHRKY